MTSSIGAPDSIDEFYKLPQNDEACAPEQFVASLQQLQAELDRGG